MGNICTSQRPDQPTIYCPHNKKSSKNQQPNIKTEINTNAVCQLCKLSKQTLEKNQDARFSDIRSMLSLTSQNVDEFAFEDQKQSKTSKINRKTIQDFEVVRGLGKGAYGRVYMIKERIQEEPLDKIQDIMSLKIEEMPEQSEIPEELNFEEIRLTKSNIQQQIKEKHNTLPQTAANTFKVESKIQPKSQIKAHQNTLSKINSGPPKYYALKILNKKAINSAQQKKQAISQRYILEAMNHPFIVKLHYAFQTKSRLYLIVDLLPGGQLFYLLRRMKKFDEETARFYAAQILLALQYLHDKSIIYRDLKPQNILLDNEGHVRITDFGLSKVLYSTNQMTYSLCGTPQYIAPEVIMGGGYTQAADWFSFGSLIYDMLTGRPPFLSNNKNMMLKNLVTKSVPLPYYLSDQAKDLLNGLFKIKPSERLGYKEGASEIKKHKFFKTIDFEALYNMRITPPISFYRSRKESEDFYLNSGGFEKWNSWNRNFESPQNKKTKQSKDFQGFTYQNCQFQFQEDEWEQNVEQNEK